MVTFLALYAQTNLLSEEEQDMQFINDLRLADRYTCGVLYSLIMVALLCVDVLLLKRLKTVYPSFYKKEKTKV